MSDQRDLIVPELGESITEAVVARWLKNPGDRVAADEPVVDLETDKITVQLPAPADGVLVAQLVSTGKTVEVGAVVGRIDTSADAVASATGGSQAASEDRAKENGGKAGTSQKSGNESAARRAPETSADTGKGKDAGAGAGKAQARTAPARSERSAEAARQSPDAGEPDAMARLTPSQRRAVRMGQPLPSQPVRGSESARDERSEAPARTREEAVAMSPLRRRIAERLVKVQQETASLTTFNEVDMSAILSLREQHKDEFLAEHGVKLGFMSFFVKACVAACKRFPGLHAEVRGDEIAYKHSYHFGVAVSTERGLVVPVLRDVDRMSLADIEKGIIELATRARDSKLTLEDLTGGTFTITNGGIFGSMMSTPILNFPQTGILGMHNIVKRPVVIDDAVAIRPIMYVALTYDHRVVDGREAVQFLVTVKKHLEQPGRLFLDL